MPVTDTVETYLGALEAGNFRKAAALLTEDFIATGIVPEAMNRNEFMSLMKGLAVAMPDISFNVTDLRVEGNRLRLTTHIRGTHTHTLSLPSLDISPVKPTELEVVLPAEPMEFTVKDGAISAVKVIPVPGGGIAGFIERLAAELSTRA